MNLNFRKASTEDIDQLVELRKKQLIDEGIEPSINIDLELSDFFMRKLADDTLTQWLVEADGKVIACGAVVFYEFPPSYTNRTGKKAYIANMYTDENYRGQGIAKILLMKLVEEVKLRGVSKIWLSASTMGKPVYKKFGFRESGEYMEFNIPT